jgi:hypothetical protein
MSFGISLRRRSSWVSRSWNASGRTNRARRRGRSDLHPVSDAVEARILLTTAAAGDQFLVAETLGYEGTPASVTVHPDGSFTTVWSSFEADGNGFGVVAQRFDANGNPLTSAPVLVNTTTAREQSAPRIAGDAAGNTLIVWQSQGQDLGGYGIFGQWFDQAGSRLGGEFRVNSTQTGDQKAPAVAVDGTGRAIVTWQSFGQDGSDWGVYYTTLNAVAGGVADVIPSGDVPVNTATIGIQQAPSVAAAANGRFVIA